MDEFADKIVYLIIGIVIFVVSSINNAKKKKQKLLEQQIKNANAEKQEREKNIKNTYETLAQIVEEVRVPDSDNVIESNIQKTIEEDPLEEIEEYPQFNLKEAIIQSEILNRKYI